MLSLTWWQVGTDASIRPRERTRGGRLKLVLDETILSLSAGGGRMRMSRGGRGGNRRWMMRRVMSLCRGGSGCSGSKYGTGGRGSLGREWRDHRCGYRGGLLTRQHRRCNTYTYTVCRLIIVSPFQRERKKKKKERGKKNTTDRTLARSYERRIVERVKISSPLSPPRFARFV